MLDLLSVGGLVAACMLAYELSRTRSRLSNAEAILARLCFQLGVDPNEIPEPSEAIRNLLRSPGSRLAAITAYRQQSGADYRQASAAIDKLAAQPSDAG